jgi:hypothetical protein
VRWISEDIWGHVIEDGLVLSKNSEVLLLG